VRHCGTCDTPYCNRVDEGHHKGRRTIEVLRCIPAEEAAGRAAL